MGVISVGFTVADAIGLFGPSNDEKLFKALNKIESEIKSLKQEMIQQFNIISDQISYVAASSRVNDVLTVIQTAKDSRDKYIKALQSENAYSKKLACTEFLLTPLFRVKEAMNVLYDSFMSKDKNVSILMSINDYFVGSPNVLMTKGNEILLAIQHGLQVIGLHKRLTLEALSPLKKLNLGDCIDAINDDIKRNR